MLVLSALVSALSVVSLVSAQSSDPSSSASSTVASSTESSVASSATSGASSASGAASSTASAPATSATPKVTHVDVVVGGTSTTEGGVFQFIPPTFNATVGSVITFTFSGAPGNHTVSQTSADKPCVPLEGGFSSGFITIPAGSNGTFPSWNLTVLNDTNPIYFYCAQKNPTPHCFNGMIGAINAPATGNFSLAAVQEVAKGFLSDPNATVAVPSPALSGVGAAASAPPAISSPFTGFAVPTGTYNITVPGNTTKPTDKPSAAGVNAVSVGAVALGAALSAAYLL